MVATRSLTDSTTQNTGFIKAALERLSNTIDQINQRIEGLLVFQWISQPVIDRMNNGEGTSHRGGQTAYGRLTKLEFPKFNGEDVQGWLSYGGIKELKASWISTSFSFEALLNKVDQLETYAISLFIGGIKDKIGLTVRMFRPTKLKDAYSLAKMQEATLAIPKSRYTTLLSANKTASTPFVSKSGGYVAKSNTLVLPAPPQTVVPNRPRKQLTQQEMAERRAKHLCFYCVQRYSLGHKCSGQMCCLEVADCEEEIKDEDSVDSEIDQVLVREEEVMPQMSMNAMNGVNSYQTMRIKGHVGKQVVHMLIDCGSTHNFLDLQAAKRMWCRMNKMCPLQVAVAIRQVMSSVYMCKNFKWNLQGHEFVTYVMILPLGGCEMVLGIQCKSDKEHWEHLKIVLQTMKEHTLFAKKSKCTFAATQVEYLGHLITTEGVSTDPTTIQAMEQWPIPKTVKQLRGSLARGSPIAYLSKTLAPKHQALSTYENEFLVVLMALDKWKGYLLDRHFKIKTNHFSLKYLLNQRLTTPFQAKWLPKLFGFDYEISYNKGSENVVADSFSWLTNGSELNALVLSTVTSDLLQKIKDSYGPDAQLQKVIHQLTKELRDVVKYDVRRNKVDLAAYPRLLQPLPVPEKIWSEISMDFITGLPKSQGKSVIFLVVDRLSKYAHFMAMSHPYTASLVAQCLPKSLLAIIVQITEGGTKNVNCIPSLNRWANRGVYGQTPPLHNPYVAGESAVEMVDRSLQARERAIDMLKFHIKRAHDRMKKYADLKRIQVNLAKESQNKLSPKYYGPFMITAKVGVMAYRLDKGGLLALEPELILDRRIGKLNNRAAGYVLVKWMGHSEEDVTWELVEDLLKRFLDFSIDP
ncbi:retrotransposon-related protein [Tanacetum coccineum]